MMTRKDTIAIARGIANSDLDLGEVATLVEEVAKEIEPLTKNFDRSLFTAYCYAPALSEE